MSSAPNATDTPAPAERPEQIKAVPVRHPGRWVAAFVVLVIAVALVRSVVTNGNFMWGEVGHYLFDPASCTERA